MNDFPGGIWPVMLTPFTEEGTVDYEALDCLTEWYIGKKVNGLFSVCQSSEMFCLTLEERRRIAERVVKRSGGRIPVIASGHISDSLDDQVEELKVMAGTGIDALTLLTNRFAKRDEGDEIWIENARRVLKELPADMKLGLYECPYPYKRVLSEKIIQWCVAQGNFYFLKDTSCDMENIRMKLRLLQNTDLKLYNANTATLLESLRDGADGYCGVMANMHPELYRILYENRNEAYAEDLSGFLTISALIEKQLYPVNAKYYLSMAGVPIQLKSRMKDADQFTDTFKSEVRMLRRLSRRVYKQLMGATRDEE